MKRILAFSIFAVSLACEFGQKRNADTGLCECSFCGTGAECSLDRCTCKEEYEPDATLTSAYTILHCKKCK